MKVIPTPGTHPIVHLPAPREKSVGPGDENARQEAVDLSSIRSLEKGTIGVSPKEMERAGQVIQEARETVKGQEKSPEWRMRFNEVFDILTRKMGITPPLATEMANAILFVPREKTSEAEEEIETGKEGAVNETEEAVPPHDELVEQALYEEYVSENPVLRRLAAEARTNLEGDEIEMTGGGDLESNLKSQEDVLRKMETVAREVLDFTPQNEKADQNEPIIV